MTVAMQHQDVGAQPTLDGFDADPDAAEDAEPVPPKRLSPSGASTFNRCPRRWRFRYVQKLSEPPSADSTVGVLAHRVLEALMAKNPPQRTTGAARGLARGIWEELAASDDYQQLELSDSEAKSLRWRAWRAIEGLWHLEDPSTINVEATEMKLSVTLDEVPFLGYLDRLENHSDGLVISDYKSGRVPAVRYRGEALKQVLLYAAAVREIAGRTPVRAQLLYLGKRTVSTEATTESLDGAVAELSQTWHAIADACEADSFEPRPGPLCAYCAFVDLCDEGQAEVASRLARRTADQQSLDRLAG